MARWLQVQVDDKKPNVDAEAFLDIFTNTLRALKAINKRTSTFGSENICWRISEATKKSPLTAILVGEPMIPSGQDYSEMVIVAFVDGIKHLESSDACPPMFDEQVLGYVKHFANSRTRGINRVQFSSNGTVATAGRAVGENAVSAIRRLQQKSGQYHDYGSVEGTLALLSSRQGKQFAVDDALTGESIVCYFSTPEVEAKALDGWGHRVCVTGEVRIDKQTGNPTSVKVDDIQRLREQNDIPQWEGFGGIDITGGIESSEYVRKLRDDSYG